MAQPAGVAALWQGILGAEFSDLGIRVSADEFDRGLTEVVLAPDDPNDWPREQEAIVVGGVRFVLELARDEVPSPREPKDILEV